MQKNQSNVNALEEKVMMQKKFAFAITFLLLLGICFWKKMADDLTDHW